jgi:hypothetical protein
MMETFPDQLESCRYDVCVQKQLKLHPKWPLKVQP